VQADGDGVRVRDRESEDLGAEFGGQGEEAGGCFGWCGFGGRVEGLGGVVEA